MSDRKDVVVFKTPDRPAPRKKRKVLDEDEYVHVSHVIPLFSYPSHYHLQQLAFLKTIVDVGLGAYRCAFGPEAADWVHPRFSIARGKICNVT